MREALEQLATAALLGTQRDGRLLPLSVPERIADALAALSGRESDRALLDAAAVISTCARAGHVAAVARTDASGVAAADSLPACAPGAADALKRILAGEHGEALAEWLRLAVERSVIAPPETLPDLLAAAKGKAGLREHVAAVVGERGRWLASLNPDWAYVMASGDAAAAESLWETGSPDERYSALKLIRMENPDRARALVESTWSVDPPELRVKFVGALAANLTIADESFLEKALDDKRKPVRSAAAELLVRLPDSRLVLRMLERLRPLIECSRKAKRARPLLTVTVPEKYTKAMARDGVEEKPPTRKIGQGAWWLSELLASVPPSHWRRAWDVSPEDLVEAALAGDWAAPLLHGWLTGAMRSDDPSWAACVCITYSLDLGKVRSEAMEELRTFERLGAFLARLEPEIREAAAGAGVRAANERKDTAAAVTLLRLCPAPWSPVLSSAAVLIEPPRGGKCRYDPEPVLRAELAGLLARGVHPEFGRPAAARISECFPGDDEPLAAKPLDLLDFRLRMHQEFRS